MSAVMLAVFSKYEVADRVRTRLVSDGFPTDRVELTAARDPGQAGLITEPSAHEKFVRYFRTLLSQESERHLVERFVGRVEQGAAAIAVQPRGAVETLRAAEILAQEGAAEVVGHDLEKQSVFERAASSSDRYWMQHLTLHSHDTSSVNCIYCRLFETPED
jgi:hypothetical protein